MMSATQPEPKPYGNLIADPHEIRRAFEVIRDEGPAVYELRALDTRKGTISGYYDNADAFVRDAVSCCDAIRAPGVYQTLNPVRPELLARAVNRAVVYAKVTTGDAEIARRCWLPVDLDPIRPAGISSSDVEHKNAHAKARTVRAFLCERGFPEPICADSGNGAHLLYRIDLPNDDDARDLVKGFIAALDQKFTDNQVAIDRTTFNAARIWKAYGTVARKGDSTLDRPHRLAGFFEFPEKIQVVSCKQLERVAALYEEPERTSRSNGNGSYQPFGLEDWIAEHHVEILRIRPWRGGQKFILKRCLFDPAHTGTSAVILRHASGAISYSCLHNGCSGRAWSDVCTLLEPDYQRNDNGKTANWTKSYRETVISAPIEPAWPEQVDEAAYYGLTGRIIRTLEPATEADPAALLVQLLTAVGNIIGRNQFYEVEGARHFPNLFALIVGRTSKARKGSAWKTVARLLKMAAPEWLSQRIVGGLSSGEGLIWQVRDPIITRQPKRMNGRIEGYEEVETDPGIIDKRLLAHEPEFASLLQVCERNGSTLSELLRQAWDGGVLQAVTKTSPARVTAPHISIVGHITIDELQRRLTDTALANGLVNRFLFTVARRSKELPFGGELDDGTLVPLAEELRRVVDYAHAASGAVRFASEARREWVAVYSALSSERPGLSGAVIARAEAQVVRLALLYAVIDRSGEIRPEHLHAALAVWGYCEASAKYVFADRLGDSDADAILQALRNRGEMSRKDVTDLFSRHVPADRLARALDTLVKQGVAACTMKQTGGRPAEIWKAATRTPL